MYQRVVGLLLFFCVATPEALGCWGPRVGDPGAGLLRRAVTIALSQEKPPHPSPSSSPSTSDPDSVKPNSAVIAIPADGEFYFGKVRVAEADIPEKVKQALKDKPPAEQIVYVKAASFVRYGTVVSVIDTIRKMGFDRIGLVGDKKNRGDVKPNVPAKSSSGSSDANLSWTPAVILIDVSSKTRVKLNSQSMLLSQLRSRLQKLLDGRSDKTVFIRAPRKMLYGDVMKVIDIAKTAGAQPIGLQVDQLE